jgi:hypothetical protein
MKVKWIIISVVAFVIIVGGVVAFIFRQHIINYYLFITRDKSLENPVVLTADFQSFLKKDFISYVDTNMVFYAVQGVIEKYESLNDGTRYFKLVYYVDNKAYRTNILLSIPESAIPKYLKSDGVADNYAKTKFRNTFVDTIQVTMLEGTERRYMRAKDFEQTFTPGALIKVYALQAFPDRYLRTNTYCVNHGFIVCGISELADKYSQGMSKFWEGKGGDYNGILVATYFNMKLVFNEPK